MSIFLVVVVVVAQGAEELVAEHIGSAAGLVYPAVLRQTAQLGQERVHFGLGQMPPGGGENRTRTSPAAVRLPSSSAAS